MTSAGSTTGLQADFAELYAQRPSLARAPRRPPRHRLIKAAQVILLGLAIVSLVVVLVWPQVWPGEDRIRIGVSMTEDTAASKAEIGRLIAVTTDRLATVAPDIAIESPTGDSVIGARFIGATDAGRAYVITADFIQTSEMIGPRMILKSPRAETTLQDGTGVTLVADAGIYDRAVEVMTLAGNVTLVRGDGHEMRTESARIDLTAMTASGSEPVVAEGPGGTVSGEGFEMSENGAAIVFTGKSRATLSPGGGSILP